MELSKLELENLVNEVAGKEAVPVAQFIINTGENVSEFLIAEKLEVSASTIQISTTEASMSLGHTNAYPYGQIIIEGEGTPTFRMGPDAQDITLTNGSGVFIDGAGNFRFGDDDGHIKFQSGVFSITGSDVNINVKPEIIIARDYQKNV